MQPAPKPSPPPKAPIVDRDKKLRIIRRLIWLYFGLLIIEGRLRRWVLTQYSDLLLVVRDPVVLVIYFMALRAHVFPRNRYVVWLGIIGILSWLVSLIV